MNRFIQKTLSVGAFQCNCQILVCPISREAVLVDPGDEPEKITQAIESIEAQLQSPIKVKALFHTHAHFDHIGATRAVKEYFQARAASSGEKNFPIPQIFLHRADEEIYQNLKMQGNLFGFETGEPLPVDQYFEDGQKLAVGSMKFTILRTPGHSPGGVCMNLHQDTANGVPETVFTGDTLFQGNIGRADLWGGDEYTLVKSIRTRLMTLDGDIIAWPGHGPSTTIGEEKQSNPFI